MGGVVVGGGRVVDIAGLCLCLNLVTDNSGFILLKVKIVPKVLGSRLLSRTDFLLQNKH